jgi:RNA 3'-phosphate cyclase
MLTLDGSHGEGGGQILRTALALSVITKKPFRIENIRKNRPIPGLKASHLAGINALQSLSDSACDCAVIGSETLTFVPKPINKFRLSIDIKTAGSITLVLQSILIPLMFAKKESRIKIIGGTDVLWSPSIDYFSSVIIPQFQRFADIKIKIEKRGYYPKGAGRIELFVKPRYDSALFEDFKDLQKKVIFENLCFDLTSQDTLLFIKGISHASKDLIKAEVAERQARAAKSALNHLNVPIIIKPEYIDTESIGSGVTLSAGFSKTDELSQKQPVILGADSLGEINKRSEAVGEEATKRLLDEINSKAAVDFHLADNLIPLIGFVGGKIKTSKITEHIRSNIAVTEKFLEVKFEIDGKENIISCPQPVKPNA